MIFRWFFAKKLNREVPLGVLYVPPFMGIVLCFFTLNQHRFGNTAANIVYLAVTSLSVLFAISTNLRRFVVTLQKPYHAANLHVALSSVLATVILFAAIYCVIYLYVPGSFTGLAGNTALDEIINAVYFSAAVFTTVGFGDICAVASIAKVFVTVEMMSFFVFFVVLLGNHRTFIKPKETNEEFSHVAK